MHDDPAAKPSQKDRYRRFYLLVALVPILALAGVVAVNLPCLRLVPSNSLNISRWKLGTREWMCFDYENERLFKTSAPESPWESRDGLSVTIDHLGRLATISDMATGQVVKSVPLPSITGSLHVLDGRFILWCDQTELNALDLTDEEPRVFSRKSPFANFSTQGMQLIVGTSRFILVNPPSWRNSVDMAELSEIRDHQIVMLQTWPISAEVTVKQDQLFSFSADGLHVECRSASDGKLIETYSVPATHERLTGYTTMQNLFGSILAVYSTNFDQITFYDLKRQKYLNLDVEHSKPVYGDSSRKILFQGLRFCDQNSIQAYDLETGQLEPSFKMPFAMDWIRQLNDGRLFSFGDQDGGTFCVIGSDGKVTKRITPFRWVGFLFLAVLIVFPVWVFVWIRASAAAQGSAWGDVLLMVLSLQGCLVLRLARFEVEPTFETYQYFICLHVSLLTGCILWQICTGGRIVTRLYSLILAVDISVFLFAFLPRPMLNFVPRFAPVTIAIGCLAVAVIPVVLRCFGVRIASRVEVNDTGNSYRLTLMDLFFLTTGVAVFFALRPFNAKFPFYFFSELQSTIAVSAGLSLISLIGFCSSLSQSRIVYQFGTVVFLVAGSILLVSPLVSFFSGHSPLYHLQGLLFPETPFFSMIGVNNKINITPGIEAIARSIEATFVASFALAFIFRLRGWRFNRVVNTPRS